MNFVTTAAIAPAIYAMSRASRRQVCYALYCLFVEHSPTTVRIRYSTPFCNEKKAFCQHTSGLFVYILFFERLYLGIKHTLLLDFGLFEGGVHYSWLENEINIYFQKIKIKCQNMEMESIKIT
jgi:hypothetical protein